MNAVALTSGIRQNLFAIQRTSKQLSANAVRLSTGKKINSALDNPVSFFTAIEHTNRAKDLMMRKSEMGEGIQTIRAASNGIDSMLKLIDSAEALAQAALSSDSLEEIEALGNQYNETLEQITGVACDSSYKGVGLLRCPPESMTINFDQGGDSSLTVEGECSSATGLGLSEVAVADEGGEVSTVNAISNNDVSGSQPIATNLNSGEYVVVWRAQNDIQSEFYIRGQKYDKYGNTIGEELDIVTSNTRIAVDIGITSLSNDGFAVTWTEHNGSDWDINAKIFDDNGNEIGNKFKVNTASYDQRSSSPVALSDGSFIVTYLSGSAYNILGQRFDENGNTIGNEFQINTNDADGPPSTVESFSTSDGGFLVSWTSKDGENLVAQKYDSNANKIGNEIAINTSTDGEQRYKSITELSNGNIVFVWETTEDGIRGIYGQICDQSLNKIGDEIAIVQSNEVTSPSVISLSNEKFLVAWENWGANTISAQKYDDEGNPIESKFEIANSYTSSYALPSLIETSLGGFSAFWNNGNSEILQSSYSGYAWTESDSYINTSLDELQAAKEKLRTLQQKFSNNLSIITTRSSFTDSMVNILETGSGNLVNADMNEEGANSLMLQTQQSLGMSSLSMASQAAQSVLRLFS